MDDTHLRTTSALAWLGGGALWTVAGLVDGAGLEILWIPADLVLLLGLFTVARLGLHGGTRTGTAGLVLAGLGRVTFVVAEVLSVIQDKDENALLPAAALLSAVGMTLYGAGVIRSRRWEGPGRFAPLVVGLYPFAVMFPIVVASGGDPSETAIAIWGLTSASFGAALGLAGVSTAVAGTTSAAHRTRTGSSTPSGRP